MTHAPDWLGFFERTYPSANMALICVALYVFFKRRNWL